MKTSLLVLSVLLASTNAIDITTTPATIPAVHKADTAPTVAKKAAHIKAAAPKASDHKVDTPEHHVIAKGHIDLKKAAAVKAPSPADHDAKATKTDKKEHTHEKCMTASCKAAREENSHKDKDVHPVAKVDHDKAKMIVVHKAEKKTEKAHAHTIKTRPAAVTHADPTTKAHQKLIEAKLKADSASQEAANEKAKASDDVKSQKSLHHEAKKAKLQAHHDSKDASIKAVKAHEEKTKADKAAKAASKPDAPEHVKVEAKK